jgi:hypothetical protein
MGAGLHLYHLADVTMTVGIPGNRTTTIASAIADR